VIRELKRKYKNKMSLFSKSFCQSLSRHTIYDEASKVICWTVGDNTLTLKKFDDPMSFAETFRVCMPYFKMHFLKKHGVLGEMDAQMLKDCTHFLKYYKFQPIHMLDVNIQNMIPRDIKLYNRPVMLPDIFLYILKTDGFRATIDKECRSAFSLTFGSVFDRPRAVATAVYDVGYAKNLEKMAMNKMYIDPDITQEHLITAIISLLDETGHREEDRLGYFKPEMDKLMDVINKYPTSYGESPFKNVLVYNSRTDDFETKTEPPSKKSIC
jgi:hypothetical protein